MRITAQLVETEQNAVFYGSLIKQDKMRETVISSQYDPSKEPSVFRDEDWKIKDFNKKTFFNVLFGLLGKLWICLSGTGFNEEEENHSL